MALTLKSSLAAEWYTLNDQGGDENPARVKIKPLNGEQVDQAMEGAVFEGSGAGLSARGIKSAIRDSVIDWENINDESGPIVCKITNHRRLPWDRRVEIASVIIDRSNLSEEEQKN